MAGDIVLTVKSGFLTHLTLKMWNFNLGRPPLSWENSWYGYVHLVKDFYNMKQVWVEVVFFFQVLDGINERHLYDFELRSVVYKKCYFSCFLMQINNRSKLPYSLTTKLFWPCCSFEKTTKTTTCTTSQIIDHPYQLFQLVVCGRGHDIYNQPYK